MKSRRTQIFDLLSPDRVEALERLSPFFLTFYFLNFTSFCRCLKVSETGLFSDPRIDLFRFHIFLSEYRSRVASLGTSSSEMSSSSRAYARINFKKTKGTWSV